MLLMRDHKCMKCKAEWSAPVKWAWYSRCLSGEVTPWCVRCGAGNVMSEPARAFNGVWDLPNNLYKHERCRLLGLDALGEYDIALPQPWLDDVARVTGVYSPFEFVWLYDAQARIMGRPFAITRLGETLLTYYKSGRKHPNAELYQ